MACNRSYVESLCGGKVLLIGTGCNCIPELVKKYHVDVVIGLFESWECDIPGRLVTYHLPVRDFSVEPLFNVVTAVKLAARHLARGESVLIACRGGCGRTGTVISLFNIVYRCMGYRDAVDHYVRLRGCGPETPDQHSLLYKASEIAANAGCEPLIGKDACRKPSSYDPDFVLEAILEYVF
ncbi:hypothetical protein Pyrfu_0909 [Pyrolobus fumarii 1A]|uniref:Tyrosine specific protein phosphatases domain-containing protein n=1 Tax=Pyrolobus fumarii (strain DSM 11204 / 1A) TaxID=694429 RepID=G0EE84_PYRF1|nr:dual specificity protein phosphatase family protein [Pyrolobus fumarii]AEM38778.1 hypothetical protein Pyrfu_0909 [Pyrolobus fumarii 1A]